jgi:hypothetical protein
MARIKSKSARSNTEKKEKKKNAGGVKKAADKLKTKRKYRQGTLVARDMKEMGAGTKLLFYKGPFGKMVSDILAEVTKELDDVTKIMIKKDARKVIQASAEAFVGSTYEHSNTVAGKVGGKQRIMRNHVDAVHDIQTQ